MDKPGIFTQLYDWVLAKSRHRLAVWWLGLLSFAESSFFPIPPDVMLAPMVLAERRKAWFLASVTTMTSVAGGVLGYLIGSLLIGSIEPWLMESHYADAYSRSLEWFQRYGVWVVFIAGFSPIPYKVFTIGAGAASMSFVPFIIASLVGRGARVFLVAGVIFAGGPRAEQQLRVYVDRIGWASVVVVAGALLWLAVR